jgi:hypothetical protein
MLVVFHQIININFRMLPTLSTPQQQQQIVYTLQPSVAADSSITTLPKDKTPSQTITYSIVINS